MPRILEIALLGHPVLLSRASEVADLHDPEVQAFVDDLLATMFEVDAVGLAAPQVFRPDRIFVMRSRKSERFPDAPDMPPSVIINPEVLSQSEEKIVAWEACKSMPGYVGKVRRPSMIRARWNTREGQTVEQELCDLAARVFLHELDHLDGVMYLERFESIRDLVSKNEWDRTYKHAK